jgi:alkylation response protein AidB-like acyl-CoA dehydrogenase
MFARQKPQIRRWLYGRCHKNIVPAGDQADAFIVPAQLDGKIALFLVENGREGVSTKPYATQDEGARPIWSAMPHRPP